MSVAAWGNPYTVGAPSREERADVGMRPCVICKEWKPEDEGEDQPHGEIICNACGDNPRQCVACLRTFPLREFVDPSGLDDRCGPCAFARDQQ